MIAIVEFIDKYIKIATKNLFNSAQVYTGKCDHNEERN